MRIFVTGANGFLGKAFCQFAIERGHEVLGLVRHAEDVLPAGSLSVRGSLTRLPWNAIQRFNPDTALHLAWIATPGRHLDSPVNALLARQSGKLFRGLARLGVRHLAGTGTFIEYAASRQPLVEDVSPPGPLFPYSRAKLETRERLQELAVDSGLAWTWFHVFNAYGCGEDKARVASATMATLASGQPTLVRTPDSVRDFIHVSDVASGMIHTLECGLGGAVNIGSGSGIRIVELARHAAQVVGADPSLVVAANPPADDPMPVAVADNAKLRTTGWQPKVALIDGLRRLWQARSSAP